MKWCNQYQCWCSDAEEITDGMGDCDYDCRDCPEAEEVVQNKNRRIKA